DAAPAGEPQNDLRAAPGEQPERLVDYRKALERDAGAGPEDPHRTAGPRVPLLARLARREKPVVAGDVDGRDLVARQAEGGREVLAMGASIEQHVVGERA